MITRRACLLALSAGPFAARAQASYPTRPVRLLVGFAAGGITDITARQVAEAMAPFLGQALVVENKAGAGGNIASAELARTTPDGYTLMVASPGQLVVNPLTQKSVGFDPKTEFSLVGLINTSPFVVVVPGNSPFKSAAELVAWGKQHPGKLSFASPGIGTTMHIGGEMLNALAGVQAVHIPYKGGAQSTADLVAGRVDFMIDSLGAVSGQVESGQLRVIGVTSPGKMTRFPDAQPMNTLYPDFELSSWLGLVGPPRMPADVVTLLASALAKAVRTPKFVETVEKRGSSVADTSPAYFAAHLKRERERIERTVVKSGLRLD
ncbi:tripartite tricarboxylate transporter substrate binding protein [Caenimonas sedimenti]|uniref:Tripartite tricarboxylate transporter substrate binding protein n=1 Tax=Caenimonas sedimenti TaxID=2596921 RepID=A0A562ZJA1_9BURK|nr:tripartite tricarboxylate transporter substrate binding protein [Caenimonas sedimenti]TWO68477.1 tripartite tricarboxylate transporter substrate binding protein [Caenimonas sedimenti]